MVLAKFEEIITADLLRSNPTANFKTIPLDINRSVKLNKLMNNVKKQIKKVDKKKIEPPAMDKELAWFFFQTLEKLAHEDLIDIRFWQWLSLHPFREFSEKRLGKKIDDITESALFDRLLGKKPTLRTLNRQVIMRLYFGAKSAGTEKRTRIVFQHQQLMQSLFDGSIGKNCRTAQGIIEAFEIGTVTNTLIKNRVKRMNALAETILLDYLDPKEIKILCEEI